MHQHMPGKPRLDHIPQELASLRDHELLAREHLSEHALAYFHGGAADELTVQANLEAWQQIRLLPRVLKPTAGGHTRTRLLNKVCPHPIMLAPVAYQRMAHPDGELATACAASAQGAGLILSTQASTPLEHVAQAIASDEGRGPLWFQLYVQHDRAFTLELVQRAEQAGYEALVLTVDAPCTGARDRERRAGFQLPPGIEAVNLRGMRPAPSRNLQAGQSALFDGLLHQAMSWHDVAWLREQTKLPILLKGILHEDDARQAAQLGVHGLIVSNHGGRTLDTAVSTAWALPRIVQAIDGQLPVLVDGGIRRGTDVLKAMALGASAVMIGRPYINGLANAGALGVAHVIRLLRDEFEIAMALTGCRTVADIHRGLLIPTA